jgi:hypothetical protein
LFFESISKDQVSTQLQQLQQQLARKHANACQERTQS